jgi:hypothetical protein
MRRSASGVADIRKVDVDHERAVVALGQRIAARHFAKQAAKLSERCR